MENRLTGYAVAEEENKRRIRKGAIGQDGLALVVAEPAVVSNVSIGTSVGVSFRVAQRAGRGGAHLVG